MSMSIHVRIPFIPNLRFGGHGLFQGLEEGVIRIFGRFRNPSGKLQLVLQWLQESLPAPAKKMNEQMESVVPPWLHRNMRNN